MNRIVRKTLDGIEEIKPALENDGDIFTIVERLKDAITLNFPHDHVVNILDSYETIDVLLFEACELDEREVGFIFNKVMQYNFIVNSKKNNIVIEYDLFEKNGLNLEQATKLLHKYYEEDLTDEEEVLINDIFKKSQEKSNKIKDTYKLVENFTRKHNHSKQEFDELINVLKLLKVTPKLIDSYVAYLKEKEHECPVIKRVNKVNSKRVVLPSRKELKHKLNELYHPEKNEKYFDLKDIEEVLKILKLLSISDERVKLILNDLYRCAITNERYYEYLIKKAKYMNKYSKKIEQITELKEMANEEDIKQEAEVWLQEIYDSMNHIMIDSFEYESQLYKKV